jgi:hypothetical protein
LLAESTLDVGYRFAVIIMMIKKPRFGGAFCGPQVLVGRFANECSAPIPGPFPGLDWRPPGLVGIPTVIVKSLAKVA